MEAVGYRRLNRRILRLTSIHLFVRNFFFLTLVRRWTLRLCFRASSWLVLYRQNYFLHNAGAICPANGKKVIFRARKNRSQNVAFRRWPQRNRYPF